jgi:hypothetical protein
MGVEGKDSILDALWQGKFYIILVFLLVIGIMASTYYYLDSKGLKSRLAQKDSDYNGLDDKYNKLSYDYSALVQSNDDLNKRFNDVSDRYNKLSVEDQYLKSSYDGLKGSVDRLQETGGSVIALHYDFYEGGPSNNRKNYLEATIYNVGNKRDDWVTIKCQIVNSDNTTSISEQAFSNVDPLDKRHVKWEYSTSTHLGSIWYET